MDWAKNRELLKVIASMKTTATYRYLLDIWENGDVQTRATALKYLSDYDSAVVKDIIEKSVRDPEPLIRKTALIIIRNLDNYYNPKPFFDSLNDENEEVVREAILGLRKFKSVEATNGIISFLKLDNEVLCQAALEALIGRKDVKVINEILNILPNASEKIRILAIRLLGGYANVKLIEPLKFMWKAATTAEKISIVSVISRIDDMRATNFLMNIFTQENRVVKISILRSIKKSSSRIIRLFLNELSETDEFMGSIISETIYRFVSAREDLLHMTFEYIRKKINVKEEDNVQKDDDVVLDKIDHLGKSVKRILSMLNSRGFYTYFLDILKINFSSLPANYKDMIKNYLVGTEYEDDSGIFIEAAELKYRWQRDKLIDIIMRDLKNKKSASKTGEFLINYAKLLGKIKRDESADILIGFLNETVKENERCRIIESLGNTGVSKALSFMIEHYEMTVSPKEKKSILRSLSNYNNKIAFKLITEAVKDSNSELRTAAIIGLTNFENNDEKSEILLNCLNDTDCRVRASAVSQIGLIKDRRMLNDLYNMLDDEDLRVQANAIEAIENSAIPIIDKNNLKKNISPKLKSENNRVKGNAIKVLYSLMPDECFQEIKKLAASDDKWARCTAAWVCGELKDIKAVKFLGILVQDSDSRVRTNAVKSLTNQTDEELQKEAFKIIIELGEKGLINIEEDIDNELDTETQKQNIASVLKKLREEKSEAVS